MRVIWKFQKEILFLIRLGIRCEINSMENEIQFLGKKSFETKLKYIICFKIK